ncbi:MAG TPA: hypothetical protein VK213_13975 [Bacteroidales bacterium]|nr:hypothetical protein [Bacteroidales bacterium]
MIRKRIFKALKYCPLLVLFFIFQNLTGHSTVHGNNEIVVQNIPPETQISNGLINGRMYLPDAVNGYYRSTRFDWSGAVYSLQYKGHEFYGPWYDRVDPKVINWVYEGKEIVSGPCSALMGPVDEFHIPLGWDDAATGGIFIKIGVGALRKEGNEYNRFAPYEVVNSGKWTVSQSADSVAFVQELNDTGTGYAYVYRKVVKVLPGKPVMVISHSLRNTGRLVIRSNVYNHNFLVLDKQAPGPDFTVKMPFKITANRPVKEDLVEVKGKQIVYKKQLSGTEEAVVEMGGFSNSIKDTELIIENSKVGAGMRVTGDQPLINNILWSVRTVLAVEPYILIDIKPGDEFSWNNYFEYYTTLRP